MPLSEHEQKLLDQLEQQLNAEDPHFASTMDTESETPQASFAVRNVVVGILVVLVGLGIIIAGVASKIILLGVGGFIVAAAGVYLATLQQQRSGKTSGSGVKKSRKQSSFMRNLEDRWDERRGQGL